MVKMRLKRIGAKKQPYYRIVIADSRTPRETNIDEIGTYNPCAEDNKFNIDTEAAKTWLKNGAQPTETVKSILKKAGVID